MSIPFFTFFVFYVIVFLCVQENVQSLGLRRSKQQARPLANQKNVTPKPEFKQVFIQLSRQNTRKSLECNPTLFNLRTKKYQTEFEKVGIQFKLLLKKAIQQKKQQEPEFNGFQDILQRPVKELKPSDFLSVSFLKTFLTLIPSSTKSMTFGIPSGHIKLKTEFHEARLRFQKVLQLSKEGKLETPEGKALISNHDIYTIRYQPIVDLAAIQKKKGEFSTRRQPKEVEAWTPFNEMAKVLPEFQKYFFVLDAFQMLGKHCSMGPENISSLKRRFIISLSTAKDRSKLICPTKTELNDLKQGVHKEIAKQVWHMHGLMMKYYKDVHGKPYLKENMIMTSETLEPIFSNTILEALKNLVPKKETAFLSYLDSLLPKLQHRNSLVENSVRGFLQVNAKEELNTQGYSRKGKELSFFFSPDNKLIIDVDFIFDVSKAEEVMKKYETFTTTNKNKAIIPWPLQVVNAFKAHNEIQSPYIKSIFYKRLEQVCHPIKRPSQPNSNTNKRRNPFSRTQNSTNSQKKRKQGTN